MGEVFAYVQQQWRSQPFSVKDLMLKVECHGQAMQAELEAKQQTLLIDIRRTPSQFEVPPPLPAMDEPDIYVLHPDAMQTNNVRNDNNHLCTEVAKMFVWILVSNNPLHSTHSCRNTCRDNNNHPQ